MVPHHLHEPCATECLQAGKHVLLEKTLAHTVESCQKLLNQAERAKQVFMVGENSTFWPEVYITVFKGGILLCKVHLVLFLACKEGTSLGKQYQPKQLLFLS